MNYKKTIFTIFASFLVFIDSFCAGVYYEKLIAYSLYSNITKEILAKMQVLKISIIALSLLFFICFIGIQIKNNWLVAIAFLLTPIIILYNL